MRNIHFPASVQDLGRARRRLTFEELFYLQLSLLRQKSIRMRGESGVVFRRIGDYFNKTYAGLPFPLTGAQKRVLKEIRSDVAGGRQMNRLLQELEHGNILLGYILNVNLKRGRLWYCL